MTGRFLPWFFLLLILHFPLPAAADFLSTLGIRPFWDMERTKDAFTRAGIPAYDFFRDAWRDGEYENEFTGRVTHNILQTLKQEYAPAFVEPATECLYYRNALEQREDVHAVAVCFLDKKYQYLVAVYFDNDKTDTKTISKLLTEKYGKQDEKTGQWHENPGIYAGLLTTKIVTIEDFAEDDPSRPVLTDICAAVAYVNTAETMKYVNNKRDELKQAEEKAKKDQRKGL